MGSFVRSLTVRKPLVSEAKTMSYPLPYTTEPVEHHSSVSPRNVVDARLQPNGSHTERH